jgi:hypothetical protein
MKFNKKALKILTLWLVAEGFIWVFFHEVISYNNLAIAILYFLTLSVIVIFLFKDIFKNIAKETKTSSYFLLLISLVLHAIAYWICNNFLREPIELIKNNSASFILVNKYFLLVKPIDVLLQQTMIIVLVKKLHQSRVSLQNIIFSIAIIFGTTHIYGVRKMELIPALLLTIVATSMSLIFPYLILKVKEGYLYNFMIHLAFVDIAALLIWLTY